jgi:phosphoribosylpyrophosphate synthetase
MLKHGKTDNYYETDISTLSLHKSHIFGYHKLFVHQLYFTELMISVIQEKLTEYCAVVISTIPS